jgi:hypothetical protein
MFPSNALTRPRYAPAALAGKKSSCELLGIDAYAEDDLGYAPS